ncbi:MAG: NAD-dependent epimerase/dehydratase family protein [Actinomycetota bacterium]|nr:NAD-dependent epimerase/dehydratase family protein [Actinomycetota bacterium]
MSASPVLVIGGAGFVGSHIVDGLLALGCQVRVLDILEERAHSGRPDYLAEGAEYIWGDVRDPEVVRQSLDGVEAVSHQGAMVGLGVDFSDAPDYVSHNSLGTAVLLRAMHDAGFEGRLVLASSMVVYGEGRFRCSEHGVVPPAPRSVEALGAGEFEPPCPHCGRALEPKAVPEDAPTDPRNVYAATKLNQEQLCTVWAREARAPLISLRYHNVYGPRMPRDTPYAGVASIFRSALESGQAPRVFEDGAQLRDFVHVRDVARANLLALEAAHGVSGAFNVASGTPRSIGEMAGELSKAMGGPMPDVTGEFRLGDVRHVFASTDRASTELGFEAQIGFSDGILEFAAAPLRSPA